MKIRTRLLMAATAVAGVGGGFAEVSATSALPSNVDAVSAPSPSFAAQVAERLYPSGAPIVVLVPSEQNDVTNVLKNTLNGHPLSNSVSLVAGQALASRFGGPVLLTQNADNLGPATATALAAMTAPQVNPNPTYEVQPYQLTAGLPTLYLVGGAGAFGSSLINSLKAQGYQINEITSGNPVDLLSQVQAIVAPATPLASNQAAFPTSWTAYAGGQSHNSAYDAPAGSPSWLTQGVSWNFAESAAVPFNQSFADVQQLGLRNAPVKMTQSLGNSVGVTAVGGIIYAESSDYHLYAIDAQTGKQIWQSSALVNSMMGNPIVANGMIYVTTGDTGFSFAQLIKFYQNNGNFSLTRGLMYSAIYAFNQNTGRMVWRQDFHGEAMASPVVVGSNVYEPTGGGHLWAFDGATGAVKFETVLGGFDSMSSPNTWTNPSTGQTEIITGVSNASNVVAVDASTGNVLWQQPTALSIFNTGMGDNSPAVDQANGMVFQDSVVNFDQTTKTANLAVYAMNASTGGVLWSTTLNAGAVPPAYKSGIIMVQNGVVYVGSPVTSQLFALNETTGAIMWTFNYQNAGPAGAGRGGAVLYHGVLWDAAGPTVYAINPTTGAEISSFTPGGRFGIVNPVIVGGTMYLDNSYDWIQAIPLTTIDPSFVLNS